MLEYKPNMVLSTQEYKVVGTRPIRPDGADKVTGKASYAADINLPGMIFGKILRSPHAHARIKKLDTSKAEAFPGVRAVITSADLQAPAGRASDLTEGAMVNYKFLSNNVMATDKALYKGHAIAAVAAASAAWMIGTIVMATNAKSTGAHKPSSRYPATSERLVA